MTDWNKAKVVDLKAELKKRGLQQTGLKAELVARLSAAENDGAESEATVQGENTKLDTSDATSPDTVSPVQPRSSEPPSEAILPSTTDSNTAISEQLPPEQDADTTMADLQDESSITRSAHTVESSQTTLQSEPERSALPSVEPQEAIEDRQKRKRRSQTPEVLSADVARKRIRKSDQSEAEIITSQDDAAWIEKNNSVDEAAINESSGAVVDVVKEKARVKAEDGMKHKTDSSSEALPTAEAPDDSTPKARDSRYKDLFSSGQSGAVAGARMDKSESRDQAHDESEPERDVSPAIHAATAAIYIRDFMRPLNQAQLKTYVATLATPPSRDVDTDIIVDFHLDAIRTHAFISFTNVSAASRVRSALHGRIWPDERTRKPLWVDFIPLASVKDWIEVEESKSGAGRGSAKKWEVSYDVDEDRQVKASLREVGSIISQNPRRPSAQDQVFTVQAPTSIPARESGEVPSGPRAEQMRETVRAATNTATLNQLFKFTETKPVLYWMPVSKEIADKRLEILDDTTSKQYSKNGRDDVEINRYTFQDGTTLVDRGPEMFGGIRPPPGFRGPQFGSSGPPGRRGGHGGGFGGGRGGTYDSYRSGGDRRGSGYRGFRNEGRY